MNENVLKSVKEAREGTKKRKFSQSFDLIVNLKLIDLKRPENRLNEVFSLPKGRGKEAKITIFSDNLKVEGVTVLKSADIEKLGSDKKGLKRLVKETDFFLSEPKLMPVVGKSLGKVLAPRGKMPAILAGNQKEIMANYKKSVRLKMKESPVIQCIVGVESMKDEDVAENIEAVMSHLERKLPKGRNNIANAMVKLTMGKRIKIEA
jgi:large subunit ribosomal protein L1